MKVDSGQEPNELRDDELLEHVAGWAAALRAVGQRWTFRGNAGRLRAHRVEDVTRLVERLERAANVLEPAVPDTDAAPRLAASDDRFRLLVDGVQDYAIFMLDPEGRIASWNAGAERIKGYLAEEIIGRHFSVFYTPEAAASGHPKRELDHAVRDGRYHEEGWRVRRDGRRFWADVTVTALRGTTGELRGFAKVTRDLTERMRAEEGLRQSEERFRLLVENVEDYAILMLDTAGHVTTWNPGAERLTGYTTEQILAQHFSIFYPREAVDAGHPQRELEIATDEGRYAEEGLRVRKDGTTFWAGVVLTPIRDAMGELRGFAKVTRDLTGRKQAEDAIHAANAELEQRVKERTAELEATNRELESFSYSVSHDLRAPLRGVDGFSKILLQKYGEVLDTQGRHYLERIRSGTQRMGALIDDILRLSRLARAELRWMPVDLAVLAREVTEELQRTSPARRVELVVAEPLRTVGDRQLLRVVLENLLGNAWKFTGKNEEARVELGSEMLDGERRFFVRDDGAGFDMTYADKLFGPFQRLHDAEEFEGTGVGLATVQRIVLRHGGRVWAEGAPGHGATFWFTLGKGLAT